jgi:outer membrane receptor protein involved in Fe transport
MADKLALRGLWGGYGTSILLASSALCAPGIAQAQQANAVEMEEIIVTATKRSENLQKVPISIQALSPEKLEQHQVATFDDYAKLLPSVSYQSFGPGQSQLFFRGISSGGDGLPGGSLPATGLYLDEIPVTTIGSSVDLHVYDIARVEALSGPQGTLFGASSLSGTLRLITNKPNPSKFEAGYDLQLNKFGEGDVGGMAEAFVNLPLSETIALRLVGFYQRDGGYIDNTPKTRTYVLDDLDDDTNFVANNAAFVEKNFNDAETYGGRAALGIDLDDNWTVTPTIIYQHLTSHGTFLYDPRAGDLEVHDFKPDRNFDEWYQAALTVEGKIGSWDLVYSGGYFRRTIDNQADYSYYTVAYDVYGLESGSPGYYTNFVDANGDFLDPTQGYHNHQRLRKQTHELRVSSPKDSRFRLVAGVFYQRQSNRNVADYYIDGLGAIPDSPAVFGDNIFLTRTHIVHRDYAAFGEASLDIVPGVTLTGGIRAFRYRNTLFGFSGFASNAEAVGCTVPIDTSCVNVDKVAKESGETHKLNLTWQVDPDHMVYATYSTGFRPGGNNRRPGINPYKADTIDNYEIGFKTAWLNRTLRINGALFIEDWNDLQYALAPPGGFGVTNIYNAGNARVKGIEADFSWALGPLTLSGSGAYTDAKLTTDFCNVDLTTLNPFPSCTVADGNVAAPKGTRLPIQPKFKGNATARYRFDLGSIDSYVQASMLHQSGTRSYLGDVEAALLGPTKGFTTFDFAAGGRKDNWTFEIFIQNAFDKRGQLSINTVCAPIYCGVNARIYPVKPQFFGVKVGQRF